MKIGTTVKIVKTGSKSLRGATAVTTSKVQDGFVFVQVLKKDGTPRKHNEFRVAATDLNIVTQF